MKTKQCGACHVKARNSVIDFVMCVHLNSLFESEMNVCCVTQ